MRGSRGRMRRAGAGSSLRPAFVRDAGQCMCFLIAPGPVFAYTPCIRAGPRDGGCARLRIG